MSARERARAPAKVNLLLRVGGRDADGYHPIETLFCALELADELTVDVAEGDAVRLEVEGADLGPTEENLAVRAARAFLSAAGAEREVSIRLRKRIPAGGGLGGGSSDAAAVLNVLDRLIPDAVDPPELRRMARNLGSDVPFFLNRRPTAWGSGRGERLRDGPALPSLPVLLAIPPFRIATAAAYAWLDEARGPTALPSSAPDPLPAPSGITSWDDVAAAATNDFETVVFERHPELRRVGELLAGTRPLVSMLSGSGSTQFAVFSDEDRATAAASVLRTRAPDVRLELTRTTSR